MAKPAPFYLVIASGASDAPAIEVHYTSPAAFDIFAAWKSVMLVEEGDRIDLFRVEDQNGTPVTVPMESIAYGY